MDARGPELPAPAGPRNSARFSGLPVTLWLALAALLPFAPALQSGFTFDDTGLIVENPAVWAASPAKAWTGPYWPDRIGTGLYRPWTTFSYWWNGKIAGHTPAWFHAVNLLLHLATVLLLHDLLRRLFPERKRLALAVALLFAVHPLHSEAVVSIVGRAELWAAVLGLGGWILAIGFARNGGIPRLLGTALAFALALLSKESAAGLLLLPVLHLGLDRGRTSAVAAMARHARATEAGARSPATDLASTAPGTPATAEAVRRRWLQVFGAWGAILALVLLLRARVLGSAFALSTVGIADNALAHEPALQRMANALGIQWLMAWRTLFPWTLTADASYPQIVPGAGWMASGALLLVAIVALTAFAVRRRDRELLWGLGIVLAGGFVTSNVPVAVGTIYGERLAYFPSAGSIWLLGVAAARLHSRSPSTRVIPALAITWGLFLAGRSWVRSLDWKDDLALFRATTAISPRSAKAWTNLSVAFLEHDRVPEALEASGRALELLPGYLGAREARATALTRSDRAAEAVELLLPALRETPPRTRSLIELGNAWLTLRRGVEAESAFAAAARALPPHDPSAGIGFASSLAMQERWREAANAWRYIAVRKPDDPAVQRAFAYSLWRAEVPDSAEAIYRALIARDERDAAARNELAWFLARAGRNPQEAIHLARAAFRLQPDPNTADTLLESLLAAGDRPAARAWLDSLAAAPPPSLGPDGIRALQERWEQYPGSRTLDDGRADHSGRHPPLPEEKR
jgi:tetratricopeptide (TPR) repeat protein